MFIIDFMALTSSRGRDSFGPAEPRDFTILLYLGFSFFQDLALVYPVYMIYFEQQGLDYLRISWLLAIWGVPVLLMEIPSGIAADLWSRKWTLVIGMVLKGGGFLIWLARPDFLGFALGFVLWGMQEGICTGVGEALLYDSLSARGEEDRFVEISGRGGLLRRVAIILSVLLGGVLFTASPGAVMVVSAVAMVIAGGCAGLIREDTVAHRGEPAVRFSGIARAARGALKGRAFLPLVVFGALATVVYGVLDEYDFLFGRTYGVPVALIGLWGGLRFSMEGLGAVAAYRIEARLGLDSPVRLAIWMTVAGLVLIPPAAIRSLYVLPLYFLFFFMMAVAELLFQGWVQRRVDSSGRATVSSLVSLVYEAFGMALILGAGPVALVHGLEGLFLAGAAAVVVAALLFGVIAVGARGHGG